MPSHEGKRLLQVLKRHGKSVADLARAASRARPAGSKELTWSAAKKWVDADVIKPGAWKTCAAGLEILGIDPREVRPDAVRQQDPRGTSFQPPVAADQLAAMLPLLDSLTLPQLRAMHAVAAGDSGLREMVRIYAEHELSRRLTAKGRKFVPGEGFYFDDDDELDSMTAITVNAPQPRNREK